MHPHALFPLLLSLIPIVASWPVDNDCYIPPGASCKNFMIPVTTTSGNYPWVGPKWNDDFGFIDFASVASSRTDAGFPLPLGAPVSQTAKYMIGATFCTPTHAGKNSGKVLLASHGLGFDRSYWNPGYKPDQYNFVQYAINEGYSVFFYDRLGVGVSDKISGWFNQINIQVSVLSQLIKSIRANQYTLLPTAPESITLVGHSFGSYMTNALLAIEPNAADAAIMTGYGLVGADARIVLEGFGPRVANIQSDNFSAFDAGYITTRDVISNINNFFKAPAYEHDVAIFSEATKQPFAISELVSLTSSLLKLNAKDYKGPALVISGEFDYILCGGYCPGELSASFDPLFTGSKGFETYVQPAVGHGLNFHKNATGAFSVIFEYLQKNGI